MINEIISQSKTFIDFKASTRCKRLLTSVIIFPQFFLNIVLEKIVVCHPNAHKRGKIVAGWENSASFRNTSHTVTFCVSVC